jgi:hypothetical protein
VKDEIYFHISNGGVTFGVDNTEHGPFVRVASQHFGHPILAMGVYVTPDGLRDLAAFFAEQAERTFREPYSCAAEVFRRGEGD